MLARLLVLFILTASGCQLFRGSTVNSGTAEAVSELLNEVKGAVDDLGSKQAVLLEAETVRQAAARDRDQFVADHVAAALLVNGQNPVVNAHTELVGRELGPATAVLPPPTAESQARVLENLELVLTQTEAARRELELSYEVEKRRAAALKTEVAATQAQVTEAQSALDRTASVLDDTVKTLADKEAEVRVAAAEAERQAARARAAAASKTRLKVAYAFMGLGGLLAVAAVVATFLRVPGVLQGGLFAGGVLLLVGWVITYVEDLLRHLWFQVAVGLVLLAAMAVVGLLTRRAWQTRHKAVMDEKISVGATGAIQELKNDDKKLGVDHYAPLKAKLEEWYVDDDGKPDEEVSREIDRRLVAMNLVNPS